MIIVRAFASEPSAVKYSIRYGANGAWSERVCRALAGLETARLCCSCKHSSSQPNASDEQKIGSRAGFQFGKQWTQRDLHFYWQTHASGINRLTKLLASRFFPLVVCVAVAGRIAGGASHRVCALFTCYQQTAALE